MMKKRLHLLVLTCVFLLFSPFVVACANTNANYSPAIPPELNLPNEDGDEDDVFADNTEESDDQINGSSPPDNVATYIRAKVNGLNLRQSPSASGNVVGSINSKDMVVYLEKVDGWYKTFYKGKTAYISASSSYTELYQMPKSDSEKIENVISIGAKFLGTKYVYGATRLHNGKGVFLTGFTDTAFDCSSFVQYAFYYGANVNLNLTTRTQVTQGKAVYGKENMRRGDLMFFTNASRYYNTGIERIGHVAIYLGDNYILHTASDYAVIEPISTTRWNYLLDIKRHV